MRKLLLTLPLLLIGCSILDPIDTVTETLTPKASVNITGYDQDYYSSLGYYSLLTVYYDIENTGNYEIDYYKIYFKVTLSDGTTVNEWCNGTSLGVGKTSSAYTIIDTRKKRYTTAIVDDVELTSY